VSHLEADEFGLFTDFGDGDRSQRQNSG